MRRAVALRCDVSGRPYHIDDFKKPLKDLGVIQQKQTASHDAPVLNKNKQVSSALDTNAERRMGNPAATDCTPTTSEQTRPAPAMHAASQLQTTCPETPASQANATSTPLNSASRCSLANELCKNEGLLGDLNTPRMESEWTSAKRRHDSDDGPQVDETQVKSEVQWKVVSGGKNRNAAQQRSSSLTRQWLRKLKVNNKDLPWTTRAQQVNVQGCQPGPAHRS
ncbi:hypothetical protein HPB51_029546 [Rhipicephalus microplus]|uniref:Uncharacterized protein n=1 Tax=Rhipicephalus microplus TaxID=6941 RepID=A0A9J6CUL0_RHIMP|nr:hypothetical protein HPB51_029546 [Rhipicephalus microplus]